MFAKDTIINGILENKLIVIVRGIPKEKLIPLGEAMYEGGVRFMELTYDASGKQPYSENAENIEMLVKHFGDRMSIGAGTVLNPEQVRMTCNAGGQFIISPDVCEEVIKETNKLSLVSIPGAFTATEAQTAHKFGADFVKLFPASSLGPDYFKLLTTPLSHIRMLAVGGVTTDTLPAYFAAGAVGTGISSGIVNKALIGKNDFAGITVLAKNFTDVIKSCKK